MNGNARTYHQKLAPLLSTNAGVVLTTSIANVIGMVDTSVHAAGKAALRGEPVYGTASGTVVESRADGLPVGTVVLHMSGWREESIPGPDEAFPVPDSVFPGPEYPLNQGVPAYHGIGASSPCRTSSSPAYTAATSS
ncbi:hypothetical protein [Actinoallomurus iriomotensis]|uniref:Uncharacterized protein n=1 Tax=Actinoallomurus iriomotensis TaxID=478107 RepID=A0A9W6SAS2_9ACTN|nr:hypothetical protein [Actinoallomurus iriomotensis]GLY91440.1 hypothetical protein Airi02_093690 [Actinoallomurus iriomotensis]